MTVSSMSGMFSTQPSIRGTTHQQTWLHMCVCVCVCVECWGGGSPSLIPTSSPIKRQGSSLTHFNPWTSGRTPPWQLGHKLAPRFPFPSSLPGPFPFSPLSLARPSHSWVFVTRLFRLPGLHPAGTRSCRLPAVTVSLASNRSSRP